MEELPPPELSTSAGAGAAVNGGAAPPDLVAASAAPAAASKRQRRPSVRLGDIGEAPATSSFPYDPSPLRRTKPSKPSSSKSRHAPSSSSAAAAAAAAIEDGPLLPIDENLEPLGAALRRATREARARRRRPRSSWFAAAAAAAESQPNGAGGFADDDDAYMKVEDDEAWVFEGRDGGVPPATDPVEGDTPSGSDGEDWTDRNGRWQSVEDAGGIQSWLDRLGLGRYGLVFEIHEVDDEVLPLLTLEDLKDMGINAVGSRRKLYCAIQNLKKERGIS